MFVYAQGGGTSMGTEFWTAYMSNSNPPVGNQGSQMFLYITSNVNTTGHVQIADNSFSQDFSVTANQVTIVQIPTSAYLPDKGIYNKGIHITSLNPIAIYAHIFANESSGATLLLPVNTMGKDYYSVNYTQKANATAYSALMVVATEDSTTVQITPGPSNTLLKPTTVTLSKGQVYELLNGTDLTGTRVQSIGNGTSSCKRIAMFSGSTRILVGCPNTSSDNLFQQNYPTSSWGDKFITVPLKNRPYDVFRVIMTDPNTVLTINGKTISQSAYAQTLFYEFNSTTPNVISADKPIQVAQYAVTQGNNVDCKEVAADTGDPEMILLTPLEQTLNHVTLYSTKNFEILQSYINVLIPANGISSFVLDGTSYSNFTRIPNNTSYAYAQIPVATGAHNISSEVGFNATAYGFGYAESYGYAAGANLANLNEFMALKNLQTDSLQYNGCTNEKYNLQIALPYKTTKITWNFNDNTTPFVQNNPAIVSTKVSSGQTLYLYQYSQGPISYNKRGSYAIQATVSNSGNDNCGQDELVKFNFNISNLPVANFDVDNTYIGTATSFKDEAVPDTTIKTWDWNFGDGTNSELQNPQHTYASPGKYTVTEIVIDVDGCSSSIQKVVDIQIVVTPLSGSISTCQGTPSADPNIGTFTVTAGSLNAPLVITPPSGFEVSLSPDDGYAGNLSIPPSAGSISKVNIYIRSSATAPAGNLTGNVSVTSAGATSVQFQVTGIINTVPTMQQVTDVQYKNGAVTAPVNFTGKGNSFTWTNDTPSIGLAASGDTSIPSFTATNNTGTTNITATITVVPKFATVAYIANSDSNSVSIINTTTNSVVGTIKVPGFPEGVAACSKTAKVYISDFQNGTVSVIDANNNVVSNTIAVGNNPLGICVTPDGSKVFVVNSFSNNVSIIDGNSDKVIGTVSVGTKPVGIATNADGSEIYVTNTGSNSVSVINTQTASLSTAIPVGNYPYGLALSADGGTLYVANTSSNSVSVISTATNQVKATISVGTNPYGVAITPDGGYVYVTNTLSNNVSVISTSANKAIGAIPVGSYPYGVAISPDGTTAYVANQGSGTVSVIDTKTNTVSSSLKTSLGPRSFGNFIVSGTGCAGMPMQFRITVFPTPPVKIMATGLLSNLTTTYGMSSSSTSFTLSGANTVAPLTIIAPDGFEISEDNSIFMPAISLGDTGTVAPVNIYARLKSSTPAGAYPNDIIKIGTKNADTLRTMAIPLGTVMRAPLIIKADDKQRPYGYDNPPLTITYSGFVNNEQPSNLADLPVVTTSATIASPVGKYEIIVDSAVSNNYAFVYIPGVLSISPSKLAIPNTFTPNGDGINDVWNIKYLDYYPKCTVDVFSRYGAKLFHSIGYSVPWDGTFRGQLLPAGTYYYIINLRNGSGQLSGYITIIK